jgi:hypothetical protein
MALRKTQWVASILLIAIPLFWQLRETKMDPLNIIVMGGGLLWLSTTAIREDWHYDRLNRIRRSRWFRAAILVVIVFSTVGFAYRAHSLAAVSVNAGKGKDANLPGKSVPPPSVTLQLPSTGNLKQRAMALSKEIMLDLWRNGWPEVPD